MDKVSNFVNGKLAETRDGETTPLVDPCTGTEYGAAANSGAADVDEAVAAATAAFEGWAATTPSDRGRALLRIADAVGPTMGTTALSIATRLLGLLLAAIAIQTMAEGLKELFPGLA